MIAVRPVGHLLRDELGVGNDDVGPLRGAHDAGAYADVPYGASKVTNLDRVTFVDRMLEEKNQTGDEVIDHTLKPEADANAERTGQHRDLAQSAPSTPITATNPTARMT